QEALRELTRSILTDHVTHDRLKALEAAGDWFDQSTWAELAKAKLLGVAIPEEFGGSGLGSLELYLLVEEVGRAVAPIPVLPSLVLGALPVMQFGNQKQKQRYLPRVASGDHILSAALVELPFGDPVAPATKARRDGKVWRLDGVKACVPAAEFASHIVVPARVGDSGVGLFMLDPKGAGVKIERQILTNAEPHGRLTLDGAAVSADDL